MVVIKEVSAKKIKDSRKEDTILVKIKTNVGVFSASSPSGKSKGKHEVKPYKKNIEGDIKSLNDLKEYFNEEILENFNDLRRVEDIVEGHIGGNTLFALESAILKAMTKKQKKEIWELINPKSKKLPRLVGNCIGGGVHTKNKKKPDFQEFLIIPNKGSVKGNFTESLKLKEKAKNILKREDKTFESKKNDENAWITSLNEKEVCDVLKSLNVDFGIDVAASSFYKRKKYQYNNPVLKRSPEEQIAYLSNLIKNYPIIYMEDPMDEEDFEGFANLLKKIKNCMIVGDDLVVTDSKRLDKAINNKSVNAIIVKPNQCGSLLEVEKVCKIAKENNIKMTFSHRSGETEETILADLAFGFGADFFKCGIDGKVRISKIERLIEIEKSLKSSN